MHARSKTSSCGTFPMREQSPHKKRMSTVPGVTGRSNTEDKE